MATSTRIATSVPPRAQTPPAQRGHHAGHDGQGAVDVGIGRAVPEREADGARGQLAGTPMAARTWLARAPRWRRTSRPRRRCPRSPRATSSSSRSTPGRHRWRWPGQDGDARRARCGGPRRRRPAGPRPAGRAARADPGRRRRPLAPRPAAARWPARRRRPRPGCRCAARAPGRRRTGGAPAPRAGARPGRRRRPARPPCGRSATTRSAPAVDVGQVEVRRGLHGVGEDVGRRRRARRTASTTSASGWITPVSLLASMTATSACTRRRQRARQRVEVDARRTRSTGSSRDVDAERSPAARHDSRTAGCSTAEHSTHGLAAAPDAAASASVPRTARLADSVPPEVKTISPGSRPEEGRHLVAGLLEQAPRPLGRRVAPGRVARAARRAPRPWPRPPRAAAVWWRRGRDRSIVASPAASGARQAIQTVLALVNSLSPSSESSRPKPDRLIPPKGSSGVEATMALTKTAPASISSMHRAISVVVVGPHARAEPEGGGVGRLDGGVEVGHPQHHGHRAEDLLLGHRHVGGDAGEHGRRRTTSRRRRATSPPPCTVAPWLRGLLDLADQLVALRLA